MSKVLPLESMRGIGCMVVVLGHFETRSPLYFMDGTHYPIVDLFFVLSGYVIAANYLERLAQTGDWLSFQIRRFWRLYPLHIATLLVFLGIETAKYVFEMRTGVQASVPAFEISNWQAFLHHLAMTHAILMSDLSFNGPSWSISAEFYTYFFFGLLAVYGRRNHLLMIVLAIFVSLAIILLVGADLTATNHAVLFRCCFSFFIGALAYHLSKDVKIEFGTPVTAVMAVICVLATIKFAVTPLQYLVPPLFGVFVIFLANLRQDSLSFKALTWRPLVYLGTISYSIYMIHDAIWWFINQSLRFVLGVPTAVDKYGITIIDLPPMEATLVTLGGVAVIIAVSHYLYVYVEERYRRGIPRRTAQRDRLPSAQ